MVSRFKQRVLDKLRMIRSILRVIVRLNAKPAED